MPANIAPTSYGTTPDNSAVTVDVYNNPPKEPVNNIPGLPSLATLSQVGGVNEFSKGLLKNITKNYLETGKLFNDKDLALKNIGEALNVNKGYLQSLGGKTLDILLKGSGFYSTGIGKVVDGIAQAATGNQLDQTVLGKYRDLTVLVGGVKQVIKNVKDIDSITDLSNLIAGVSGDNEYLKVLNLTGIAGVVKGVNDLAREYNLPGIYDKLIDKLDDDDKKRVSALVLAGTTSFKDLSTLDSMLKHLTGSEILNANPDIVNIVVSDYGPTDKYPQASKEAALHLHERLVQIDPHWHQVYVKDDVWIDDLSVFQNLSAYARDSFLSADMYKHQIAICQSYRQNNIVQLARTFYPYIGLPDTTA